MPRCQRWPACTDPGSVRQIHGTFCPKHAATLATNPARAAQRRQDTLRRQQTAQLRREFERERAPKPAKARSPRRLQRELPHQLDDSLENYALLRHIAALASV